jgi:hypothetical protein
MAVQWRTVDTIPGTLTPETYIEIDSVTFNVASLGVVGSAGPGDPRTTQTSFTIKWDASSQPSAVPFATAPVGTYSQVDLQLDGLLINPSFSVKGKVTPPGLTMMPFEISDRTALTISNPINRSLGNTPIAIGLVASFHDSLAGIDWSMVPIDDKGTLEQKYDLGTGDAQMAGFRTRLTMAIQVDGTIQ